MDRRYSKLLVLALAALFADACSSSGGGGTGGAGGSSSTGGATGAGGAGTGGRAGASGNGGSSMGGVTGTGGRTDGGVDMTTSMGGMTGVDASDAPKDMSVADTNVDVSVDADPATTEKAMCLTPMFMSNITTTPFTAAEFCTLYFSLCNGRVGVTDFANEAACEAAYTGYNTTPDADSSPTGQKGCRSYHLCNAYNGGNPTTATLNTHCPHTTGFLPNDAGPGGPCP